MTLLLTLLLIFTATFKGEVERSNAALKMRIYQIPKVDRVNPIEQRLRVGRV